MNDLFNISTEFYRHTYDHEVLLSFINDDEAYKFTEWLIEVGTELFREYLAEASTWMPLLCVWGMWG